MEQDNLKQIWQEIPAKKIEDKALRSMLLERKHPELKRIRRQLTLEIVAFSVFFFVYYDFFDGHLKPLYANILLVTAILLTILQNIFGYAVTKRRIEGDNLKQSLERFLLKIKVYAAASVAGRVLAAGSLVIFFTSVIEFTAAKWWILAGIVLFFGFQIFLLSGTWATRVRRIKRTVDSFSA